MKFIWKFFWAFLSLKMSTLKLWLLPLAPVWWFVVKHRAFFITAAAGFALWFYLSHVYNRAVDSGIEIGRQQQADHQADLVAVAQDAADKAAAIAGEINRAAISDMYAAQQTQNQLIEEIEPDVTNYYQTNPVAVDCLDADGLQLFNRLSSTADR